MSDFQTDARNCRRETPRHATYGIRVTMLVLLAAFARTAHAEPIDADVVLRGGTLLDGAGGQPLLADLAIRGDRIVAIGQFEAGKIGLELDCRGLIVAPGFIDLHNHSDSQVVDRLTRANVNFVMQGCTTVVTGNCGSGPIDVAKFYEKIDAAGAGTNVAHLVPQGNLREAVIGSAQRSATPEEIGRMQELARRGMRDGAWGMSTGLIYVPSSFADTAELTAIAKVVGEEGGLYASHIRNEGTGLLAAVNEALAIGREAKLRVHISHFKSSGREAWGLVRQAVKVIEEAQRAGQTVTADQYPYVASSTSLEATVIPAWARAGGHKELVARFDDPAQSVRLREAIAEAVHRCDDGDRLKIARYAPRPNWAGKSLAEIAQSEKVEPVEIVIQITRGGGAAIVNFSMLEEDVRYVMTVPWVATASDGRAYLPGGDRPHPRSYGTFSRKIGYYSLREQALDLPAAIRSATGLPADILHLPERGYLKQNYFADIAVFDPRQFADEATFDDPHRYSRGLKYVFVNGQPTVWNGAAVGTLAGRALKRPGSKSGFQPPVYEIRRAGTPIKIDGKLDEPAWLAGPDVGDFHFTWYQSGRKERTVAKMLWDDENLYIGHICEDAHITARHTEHDGKIPEDDCFEVIFAPDPAKPEVYFNIEWNVVGGYLDNFRPDGPTKPRTPVWDAEGVKVAGTYAGTLNDDSDTDSLWTVEVAIPLKNFEKYMPHLPPRPGEHWNLNLNRHGGATNMQYSQWSPGDSPMPSFHTPHRFGRAIFSGKVSPFAKE